MDIVRINVLIVFDLESKSSFGAAFALGFNSTEQLCARFYKVDFHGNNRRHRYSEKRETALSQRSISQQILRDWKL